MGGAGEAEGCECGEGGFLEHGGGVVLGCRVILSDFLGRFCFFVVSVINNFCFF